MAEVQQVHISESTETINRILERDGCIVLNDALSHKSLDILKTELEPHFERTPNCQGNFYGYLTKRLGGLIGKSETSQTMAMHPNVISVMDEFLLRGCNNYQLNLTQAIRIGPGEPQQMMHPDDPMFPFLHPEYESMINCMWAVDDFTKENGATHVVPGSHKWARTNLIPDREPEEHEIVQAEMPAGSVLIYFGSLLHCGGANHADTSRTGLVLSYCLGWLRQSENQYLSVSPDYAATLPKALQRLLGYFVHEPNLGQLEGRDPIEWLNGHNVAEAKFEEFVPDAMKPVLEEHRQQQLGEAA